MVTAANTYCVHHTGATPTRSGHVRVPVNRSWNWRCQLGGDEEEERQNTDQCPDDDYGQEDKSHILALSTRRTRTSQNPGQEQVMLQTLCQYRVDPVSRNRNKGAIGGILRDGP